MPSQADDLRAVFGPHAAKKISRKFGIAVVTAKLWLSGRTPAARETEIAAALLTECDRLEAQIAATRRRWGHIANAHDQKGRTKNGGMVNRARPTPHRVGSAVTS